MYVNATNNAGDNNNDHDDNNNDDADIENDNDKEPQMPHHRL